MYTLQLTEHFEDWYVADIVIGEFDSIDDAVAAFCAARDDILEMNEPADGIEDYIAENFDLNEDDEDVSDYSKGFVLKILQEEDDDILTQFFVYDHVSKSISESYLDKFNNEHFSDELINMFKDTAVSE